MKIILLGLIICIFYGCKDKKDQNLKNREGLNEAYKNNSDSTLSESSKYYYENTKIEFGQPIAFKSTNNIAIPIILEQKYVDKGMPKHSYFNIAIVNTSNVVTKLLFEHSVIIDNVLTFERQTDFDDVYYYDDDQRTFSKEYNSLIFFELWKYENRKKDNKRLFVYDLENDKLNQLSPEHCNVTNWNIFDNQSKILIHYQFDSNNNGVFDERDDENMVMVNLKDTIKSKELFDLEKLKKIKLKVAKKN